MSTGFVMIAAAGGRIGNLEASHHEGLHGVVRQAFHIWADGDPCRLQAPDGTLADIPADDKFHVIILQKCNNGVMSLPVGLHHLGVIDLSVFCLIQLEMGRMGKRLPQR